MWQVAEAKNRFSELITRALREGPQHVRRRDEEVVVVSRAEWDDLRRLRSAAGREAAEELPPLPNRHPEGKPPSQMSLGEFLVYCAPDAEGAAFPRDRSAPREVDFGA